MLMIFLYVEITFNCTRLILLNKIETNMKLNAGGAVMDAVNWLWRTTSRVRGKETIIHEVTL